MKRKRMSTQKLHYISSILHPNTVQEIVENFYNIGKIINCSFTLSGVSHVYRIESASGDYYAKIYSSHLRTSLQIQAEANIVLLLDKNNLRVATPVYRLDNSLVTEINMPEGKRGLVLFNKLEGETLNVSDIDICFKYGQATARMHSITDSLNLDVQHRPTYDAKKLLALPLNTPAEYLGKSEQRFLSQLVSLLATRISELTRIKPSFGFCHGDLNSANVLVDPLGGVGFIDFDLCGLGWRMRDIISFMYEDCYENDYSWQAYLKGYQSIRVLEQFELTSIPIFLAIYHLEVIRFTLDVNRYVAGDSVIKGVFDNLLPDLEQALAHPNSDELVLPSDWKHRWGAKPSPSPAQSLLTKK